MARICIIDGHPDPAPRHLIHALCDAYAEGAVQEDHAVSRINVGSLDFGSAHKWPEQMMKGKSARTVITMGMPGLVYRFGMDAGSLRALERGVLGLSGFKPLHHTILGGAGDVDEAKFKRWCTDMRVFGREGV